MLTDEQRNAIAFAYQILIERGTEGGWKYAAILSSILAAPSNAAQAPQPDERETCMCSGLGPCERPGDVSCRIARASAPQATAKGGDQKPTAWVRFRSDGGFEGPIMDSDSRMCDTRRTCGAWSPLFLRAAAPQATATAKSISDEMMDLADRLGSEWDKVDRRAWQHLLVYAPKPEALQPIDAPVDMNNYQGRHAYAAGWNACLADLRWCEARAAAPQGVLSDEQIEEIICAAADAWDKKADKHNKWSELDRQEKDLLIARAILAAAQGGDHAEQAAPPMAGETRIDKLIARMEARRYVQRGLLTDAKVNYRAGYNAAIDELTAILRDNKTEVSE